jgi:Ras-related protein Rab-2A
MLIYSISSRKAFKHLDRWLEEIRSNANVDPVICILGNKCDDAKSRKIDHKQGADYALRTQCPIFHEVSAKVGTNVEKAFMEAIKNIIQKYPHVLEQVSHNRKVNVTGANTVGGAADGGDGTQKKKCC